MALDYLLFCPDYRVQSPATAGIAPERIVDAGKAGQLAARITAIIAAMPPIATVSAAIVRSFLAAEPAPDDLVDVLVVDEGQDFERPWADALLRFLKPGGKAWWLEDPLQNLYDRPPVELPGWTILRADVNYRTPRDILRQMGLFVDVAAHVKPASPLEGDGIDTSTYTDFPSLRDATIAAIGKARAAGFKLADIVVLTYRGRDSSALMPFDRLGSYTLRRFDGTYDAAGNPVFDVGDILLETVFRFKGQSAPCIILTEVDFEELDERAARRLYVGAARATMQLAMVMSERAAGKLMERLA